MYSFILFGLLYLNSSVKINFSKFVIFQFNLSRFQKLLDSDGTAYALPPRVPVTQQIGVPIIDMPGCVETHELDRGRNDNLKGDDPKGAKVFCDGQIPSFNPIDYNEDELWSSITNLQFLQSTHPNPRNKAPKVPTDTKVPEVECPSELHYH